MEHSTLERTNRLARSRCFGGWVETHEHESTSTRTKMRFSVYLPPQAERGPVPWVLWLSGLTCTDENFTVKAGAQRHASELGLGLVAPDTSPRGANVPGEDAGWDLGTGAGFYVNATQAPWSGHYRMYDYVARELPALITSVFPFSPDRVSLSGHSMGGHGALVLALREPERFRSVSAFAPIVAPSRVPWGEKAFGAYLGEDRSAWLEYDACALVARATKRLPCLVDQGTADPFLTVQLRPELLEEACHRADYPVTLRRQEGYDHSYFFVATFIGEHLAFHARHLG